MVKNTWRTLKYNLTLSRFIQNLYPVSPINAGAKKSHGETEFGFSMMEVMISISVLSVMVAFAIPYFSGYQDDVKDQLHLVNSLTLRHGVESARIEGHISGPEPGNSVDVSIGDLESMGYSFDILDPSASGKKSI